MLRVGSGRRGRATARARCRLTTWRACAVVWAPTHAPRPSSAVRCARRAWVRQAAWCTSQARFCWSVRLATHWAWRHPSDCGERGGWTKRCGGYRMEARGTKERHMVQVEAQPVAGERGVREMYLILY